MHPRKAFRFSVCPPHPPQAVLHSASLRYGGAVARSPRIAMSPFPSKGKAFGCAQSAASPPFGTGKLHEAVMRGCVAVQFIQERWHVVSTPHPSTALTPSPQGEGFWHMTFLPTDRRGGSHPPAASTEQLPSRRASPATLPSQGRVNDQPTHARKVDHDRPPQQRNGKIRSSPTGCTGCRGDGPPPYHCGALSK